MTLHFNDPVGMEVLGLGIFSWVWTNYSFPHCIKARWQIPYTTSFILIIILALKYEKNRNLKLKVRKKEEQVGYQGDKGRHKYAENENTGKGKKYVEEVTQI